MARVNDTPVEIEKTWILRRQDHARLSEHLRSMAPAREVIQTNVYLCDGHGVLQAHEASVRLRTEREEGQRTIDRVVLTLKAKASGASAGAVARGEDEWDLTEHFRPFGASSGDPAPTNLPDRCLQLILDRFREPFERKGVTSCKQLELRQIATMRNRRLIAPVPCGLILELDSFTTGKPGTAQYYELEIEGGHEDAEKRDRFIHELFSDLQIPVVSHPQYPSKVVLTLVDAGLLEDRTEWISAKREVLGALNEGR